MSFTRMVDMAKTPDDVKKELKDYPQATPSSPEISVPVYPYGLCLSLTEDELDKLGIDPSGCHSGDMIHLCAMAKVTSFNEREEERTDGTRKQTCRIELQITHLATDNEDDEAYEQAPREERARRRYGGEPPAPEGEGKAGEMHVQASAYRGGKAGKPATKRYSAEGEAHLDKTNYRAA